MAVNRIQLTVLVEQQDIAAIQVDGVSSAQSGNFERPLGSAIVEQMWMEMLTAGANNDDSLRHYDECVWKGGNGLWCSGICGAAVLCSSIGNGECA
jgi:hypothetical protein